MKCFQTGGLDFCHTLFGAERVEPITGIAEQRAAHGEAGAFEQLIFLRLQTGDLDLPLAFEGIRGKSGAQEHVGHEVEPG